MKLAPDTTAIPGRGAVRDACSLIGDGCRMLIRQLADLDGQNPGQWAGDRGCGLHFDRSPRGNAAIDWPDRRQRRRLPGTVVAGAGSLLQRARTAIAASGPGDKRSGDPVESASLLARILPQDMERRPEPDEDGAGPAIRRGGGRGRLPSVHDPGMRHGR